MRKFLLNSLKYAFFKISFNQIIYYLHWVHCGCRRVDPHVSCTAAPPEACLLYPVQFQWDAGCVGDQTPSSSALLPEISEPRCCWLRLVLEQNRIENSKLLSLCEEYMQYLKTNDLKLLFETTFKNALLSLYIIEIYKSSIGRIICSDWKWTYLCCQGKYI